jgi:hypothetical protein
MGNTLWFITILKDQPWWGIVIGLVFFAFMFLSKNLIVYLYSRSKAKQQAAERQLAASDKDHTP